MWEPVQSWNKQQVAGGNKKKRILFQRGDKHRLTLNKDIFAATLILALASVFTSAVWGGGGGLGGKWRSASGTGERQRSLVTGGATVRFTFAVFFFCLHLSGGENRSET